MEATGVPSRVERQVGVVRPRPTRNTAAWSALRRSATPRPSRCLVRRKTAAVRHDSVEGRGAGLRLQAAHVVDGVEAPRTLAQCGHLCRGRIIHRATLGNLDAG